MSLSNVTGLTCFYVSMNLKAASVKCCESNSDFDNCIVFTALNMNSSLLVREVKCLKDVTGGSRFKDSKIIAGILYSFFFLNLISKLTILGLIGVLL